MSEKVWRFENEKQTNCFIDFILAIRKQNLLVIKDSKDSCKVYLKGYFDYESDFLLQMAKAYYFGWNRALREK